MFDGFLMSITNKLKKISASLDLYEGKFDEISTDVRAVNTVVSSVETKVDTVQTTSDEIKALIGTEVATQLNALESNILAAMPSGSTPQSCIASSNVKESFSYSGALGGGGSFIFYMPYTGTISIQLKNFYSSGSNTAYIYLNSVSQTAISSTSTITPFETHSLEQLYSVSVSTNTTKKTVYVHYNILSAGYYAITFNSSKYALYTSAIEVCYDLVDSYSEQINTSSGA